MNNVFAICRTGINISVVKQNEKAAKLCLEKRPGFECSRDQTVLLLLYWSLEDGKMSSFGIGVDKSREAGSMGCLNVTELYNYLLQS